MKYIFLLFVVAISISANSQNVGIGTSSPHTSALFHIEMGEEHQKGFLVKGNALFPDATLPDFGNGPRMMFYPARGAFRAGYVSGTQWDNVNVGQVSIAMGTDTYASGDGSISIGSQTFAVGTASVALGVRASAAGANAVAIGYFSSTFNSNAMAIGSNVIATGIGANAFGNTTQASGDFSTTMGNYVSTSGFSGAFAIGDNSTTITMQSFVNDGFRSRFAGGYRLLTNSAANIGVVLLASGNAWSAISDVRLKENFLPIEGESFLSKIAAMPLTTWNYIAQENKRERHYGPMAQDFYKAFGHDAMGEIGCDTLINQQDFLGVNLIAIQALEKRTAELQRENIELRKMLDAIEEKLKQLKSSKN